MDSTATVLLESWDRQADIVRRLIDRLEPDELRFKPSDDGKPIAEQLCHMHEVRYEWLNSIAPDYAKELPDVYTQEGDDWIPTYDLGTIRTAHDASAKAVHEAMADLLEKGVKRVGPYTHPVHFLEHMIWHDGWHVGLIVLALRIAGHELPEEWEELNMWGIWRDPEI